MKKALCLCIVLLLLLSGCSSEAAPTTAPTTVPTTAPTTVPTTAPTEAPTTAPTEPPVLYRNPLNGQPLEEGFTGRPTAVVINNIAWAMPHHGVTEADVIFEILAEGGITRCLALYTDLEGVGNIGSIRSARTYFISLSKAYDAPLIHNGDSNLANNLFRTGAYPHVDCEYPYFFRDQDRLNRGVALEHTMFTDGSKLTECVNKHFDMTVTADTQYGLVFDEAAQPQGDSARTVTATYRFGGKTTRFDYDAAAGAYIMTQHGQTYVDGNTGEKVTFENVIFMYSQMTNTGDSSGHVLHELLGENTGYYARDGKLAPITWTRDVELDPFTFAYADGSQVAMKPGRTYVVVLPTGSQVNFE